MSGASLVCHGVFQSSRCGRQQPANDGMCTRPSKPRPRPRCWPTKPRCLRPETEAHISAEARREARHRGASRHRDRDHSLDVYQPACKSTPPARHSRDHHSLCCPPPETTTIWSTHCATSHCAETCGSAAISHVKATLMQGWFQTTTQTITQSTTVADTCIISLHLQGHHLKQKLRDADTCDPEWNRVIDLKCQTGKPTYKARPQPAECWSSSDIKGCKADTWCRSFGHTWPSPVRPALAWGLSEHWINPGKFILMGVQIITQP